MCIKLPRVFQHPDEPWFAPRTCMCAWIAVFVAPVASYRHVGLDLCQDYALHVLFRTRQLNTTPVMAPVSIWLYVALHHRRSIVDLVSSTP